MRALVLLYRLAQFAEGLLLQLRELLRLYSSHRSAQLEAAQRRAAQIAVADDPMPLFIQAGYEFRQCGLLRVACFCLLQARAAGAVIAVFTASFQGARAGGFPLADELRQPLCR